jgi:hypothetical protein
MKHNTQTLCQRNLHKKNENLQSKTHYVYYALLCITILTPTPITIQTSHKNNIGTLSLVDQT